MKSSQVVPEESLDKLLSSKKISQITYQRVVSAKKYIERKYNLIKLRDLENNLIHQKIQNSNLSQKQKDEIYKAIEEKEKKRLHSIREKLSAFDYEPLYMIGKGAFGEVYVCRDKRNNGIVAIKKIKKQLLVSKNQIKHIKDEQDFLSKIKSPWIVELKASFQQGDYLFLVMEFLPGGDLMSLLISKDLLTEKEARFYLCEMILAIESVHKLNCIHRDIKPDNILIGKNGHIKLSDFGLAKVPDKYFKEDFFNNTEFKVNKHKRNFSCVGTPYYVAPEVLKKSGYGEEIDWWSLGVIFYEMLIGYAPFFSQETKDVCNKVVNFKKYLVFPPNITVSPAAQDLIRKLVAEPSARLGKEGVDEIKSHPFFNGVNWNKVKEMKPPFIPKLANDYDISYFEEIGKVDNFYPKDINKRKDAVYIGYTYKDDSNFQVDLIEVIEMIQKKENENTQKTETTSINNADNNCFSNALKCIKENELKKEEKLLKDRLSKNVSSLEHEGDSKRSQGLNKSGNILKVLTNKIFNRGKSKNKIAKESNMSTNTQRKHGGNI